MKQYAWALSLTVFLLTNPSFAKFTIEEVPISDSLKVEASGKPLSLPLLGAGIRKKNVAFLKFKVYVASIFAKDEKSWENTSEPIAIRMDFLRDVPNHKIVESFTSSLKTNSVNLETPEMKKLFEIVQKNGDIKEKQALTVAGIRGEKDLLTLTLSTGETQTITGNKGLVKDFFSIWFGKMDDGGLEDLREEVLSKKKI